MAPSPTSSARPSDNSTNTDNANRNKRRRNKNKRQKKQQQREQQSISQTTDKQLTINSDGPESNNDQHHVDHDCTNEPLQQQDDTSLLDDETEVIIRGEDSKLGAANTDNDDQNHSDSSTYNVCHNQDVVRDHHDNNQSQIDGSVVEQVTSSIDQTDDNNIINAANNNKVVNNKVVSATSFDGHDPQSLNSKQTHVKLEDDENAKKKKLLRSKLREYKKLKARFESQTSQMSDLTNHIRQQANKIKELESLALNSKKTCNQLEKLLQHEVVCRTKLEQEKIGLNQTVNRLKTQIGIYEKNKLTNDELMRTINATLMERDTEVSMLKLKLTRLQTNQSSLMISTNGLPNYDNDVSKSSLKGTAKDPTKAFILAGRSNSEFNRNTALRSTMIADGTTRSSTSQLRSIDNDSSVWASIPADLTPSRRPQLLEKSFQAIYNESKHNQQFNNSTSTPLARDKRYNTLPPRSMIKSSEKDDHPNHMAIKTELCDITIKSNDVKSIPQSSTKPANPTNQCQITNLDDSSTSGNISSSTNSYCANQTLPAAEKTFINMNEKKILKCPNDPSTIACNTFGLPNETLVNSQPNKDTSTLLASELNGMKANSKGTVNTMIMPPLTPSKKSSGLKRIFDRFRRTDSNASKSSDIYDDLIESSKPSSSPFRRDSNRATLVGLPGDGRAQMSPKQQKISFETDKPFAEWNTDMIVEWLTTIGLSMYSNQCRRWVKCGAHIMNATPVEVDKGLGITNHLHRKKLRLAISELNGDCDKVTKAAAKLDYLWIARWLDDIGLPQYKEAFINARVDGRVLNYLTVEDLASMGVKSVLHHNSIKCGIRVLRSTNFDLQLLKRRATADEIEELNILRQQVNHVNETLGQNTSLSLKQIVSGPSHAKNNDKSNQIVHNTNTDLSLWTCHRVMEWLRLIDFAEFAPNLRGSGVHGGLLVYEDGFNFDTMCCLLSIPLSRTLLRRHLSTYFDGLIGKDLAAKKVQYRESSPNPHLNPFDEIKTPKKSNLWPLTKLKSSSKVGQNGTDDYLVPMYPMEPQIIKTTSAQTPSQPKQQLNHIQFRNDLSTHSTPLAQIPESKNV